VVGPWSGVVAVIRFVLEIGRPVFVVYRVDLNLLRERGTGSMAGTDSHRPAAFRVNLSAGVNEIRTLAP
jgi:hypothetical protein